MKVHEIDINEILQKLYTENGFEDVKDNLLLPLIKHVDKADVEQLPAFILGFWHIKDVFQETSEFRVLYKILLEKINERILKLYDASRDNQED